MLANRNVMLAGVLLLAGCGGSSPDPGAECKGDVRFLSEVYYGTMTPTYVPLFAEQVLAIGSFDGCSGTAIGSTWVLSAKHCHLGPGARFCMGEDPGNPNVCIPVLRVIEHPDATNDLALVELELDPRDSVPTLKPIPIMTELMGEQWLGQLAEAAGYGVTDTGTFGTRYFTAEPIVSLDEGMITVDGEGVHGLCGGDSGGPVFVVAPDATVRVAGALYGGDSSCVGRDRYTRTDLARDWIESYVGPVAGEPAGCGFFDGVGSCTGNAAMWCDGSVLRAEQCAPGYACGWDSQAAGFRCIAGADPCQGYDRRGGCEGNVARWCEDGQPKSLDCNSCAQACTPFATSEGAYCRQDPCMGVDYLGRCNGNVAEWCEGNELRTFDCGTQGQSCGYVDDQIGYYCT